MRSSPPTTDNRIGSLTRGGPYTIDLFLGDQDTEGATYLGSVQTFSSGGQMDAGSYYECQQQPAKRVISRALVSITECSCTTSRAVRRVPALNRHEVAIYLEDHLRWRVVVRFQLEDQTRIQFWMWDIRSKAAGKASISGVCSYRQRGRRDATDPFFVGR